jgi:hypothetical protein
VQQLSIGKVRWRRFGSQLCRRAGRCRQWQCPGGRSVWSWCHRAQRRGCQRPAGDKGVGCVRCALLGKHMRTVETAPSTTTCFCSNDCQGAVQLIVWHGCCARHVGAHLVELVRGSDDSTAAPDVLAACRGASEHTGSGAKCSRTTGHRITHPDGPRQLHQALLQVGQGPLHQGARLPEVHLQAGGAPCACVAIACCPTHVDVTALVSSHPAARPYRAGLCRASVSDCLQIACRGRTPCSWHLNMARCAC